MVFGITKFHSYLAGTPFTLVTDHQALLYLESAKCHHSWLARWAVKLSAYDFRVQYRPGVKHGNADGLTRAHKAPNLAPSITIDTCCLTSVLAGDADFESWELHAPLEHLDDTTAFSLGTLDTDYAHISIVGPRQALLEACPCQHC